MDYYLGFDVGTQSLKLALIDSECSCVFETGIDFDADLPEYKTCGGVHKSDDSKTVTCPAGLWISALDIALSRLQSSGLNLSKIRAISGSAQQHGSVYLRRGFQDLLSHCRLSPSLSLSKQLESAIDIPCPIWMDSSTTDQCRRLEKAVGGPSALADITGSRAFERFTGPQISKLAHKQPEVYESLERICLISNFFASLFIGRYAPVDYNDASGTNLFNMHTRDWDQSCLDACAPSLRDRLGPSPVPSHSIVGKVDKYFVDKFGFDPETVVVAFSGDNANSAAAILRQPGDVGVSLGTSHTIFGFTNSYTPNHLEGHIFASPTFNEAPFFPLVCFSNGALLREEIRDRCAKGSWDEFNRLLNASLSCNVGIGFYYMLPEITPSVSKPGYFRFDKTGKPLDSFSDAEEVRACVESSCLSMRLHGERMGIKPSRIVATGGASANKCILQVLSDVFGCPVYTSDLANSAPLGAAVRAMHGRACAQGSSQKSPHKKHGSAKTKEASATIGSGSGVPFSDVAKKLPPFSLAATPCSSAHEAFNEILPMFEELEAKVVGAQQ